MRGLSNLRIDAMHDHLILACVNADVDRDDTGAVAIVLLQFLVKIRERFDHQAAQTVTLHGE